MATTRTFTPYSKAEIVAAIARLPDDATIDDAIDRLFFIRSLEVARAQVEAGDTFSQEEVEREMAEWQDRSGLAERWSTFERFGCT